jgi:hypothetical protein
MRYFNTRFIFSLVLLLSFPIKTIAWNALGHMVIATIAYQNLEPAVRDKVDDLIGHLRQEYSDINSFQQAANWPDMLRGQKIETYTHWHYVDVFFSMDGTPIKQTIDTDNAVWALTRIEKVVKNENANPYERARFLSFLVHIVGDVHQPLHTVSLVSLNHPDGDMGGNVYFVRYGNKQKNLHSLWDEGVGVFSENATPDRASLIANRITSTYPRAYFADQAKDFEPDTWVKEGMKVSQNYVYTIQEKQTPTTDYLEAGKQTAEQRAALAGYRLAGLLNQLLA